MSECVCLLKVGQQEDRKPLLTCLSAVCDFMDTKTLTYGTFRNNSPGAALTAVFC